MWLPGQGMADVAGDRRRADRARPGARLAVPARALSERAAAGRRWRAPRWSLAPDDDAAEMYLWAMARLDEAGLSAVRDLERRAAGPRVAPQPEVLERRRVARVRLRRALDARRACAGRTSPAPRSTCARDRRRACPWRTTRTRDRAGAARGRAVHRAAAGRRDRPRRHRGALRRRRLGALRRRAPPHIAAGRLIDRGRPAAADPRRACWSPTT